MSTVEAEIPLTTYRALEKEILTARAAVIREAHRIAKSRSPQATEVNREDLEEALRRIASCVEIHTGGSITGHVSDDNFSWLDRQFDEIRSQVLEVASADASDQRVSSSHVGTANVTGEMVRRAWQLIWDNVTKRSAALLG